MATEHEFSSSDNAVFAALGRSLRRASWLLWALSALVSGLSVLAFYSLYREGPVGARFGILGMAGLVLASVCATVGRWLSGAAGHVGAVADTQGADITHVMTAMRALRRTLWLLQVAAATVLALALVAGAAHHGG